MDRAARAGKQATEMPAAKIDAHTVRLTPLMRFTGTAAGAGQTGT